MPHYDASDVQAVDQPRSYDPTRDYRSYEVTAADGALLSTRAAAQMLGYGQTESVSRMVRKGTLPARRAGEGYNARIQIPEWAVRGRAHYVGKQPVQADANELATRSGDGENGSDVSARELDLEHALLVLRAAAEHERQARRLLEEAIQESGRANDLLADALGAVVMPSHPPVEK